MKTDAIHFVITGGTIDSEYNGILDTVTTREVSIIPRYMGGIKMSRPLEFSVACMKDSRQLAQEDRKAIVNIIESQDISKVIITHGTYTLPDTARYLEAQLSNNDRVIILTGSMIPLEGFTMSDGGFNLGYAVAQIDELEPGVYVCINGSVFSPSEIVKLLNEGRFGSIFGEDAD